MYTVSVIDGRANGLPILDSPVLSTDRRGHSTGKVSKRKVCLDCSGSSPLPEQKVGCRRKVFVVALQEC